MYPTVRMASGFLFSGILALVLSGWGTTHHFLPPQPLESGTWEIQVTWHADLNRVETPFRSMVFPEVSAYLGLGRGWNLGGGGYFMLPISHLSVAKYFSNSTDRYTALYGHGASPLNFTNNPRYETGVMFSSIKPDHSVQYGFGIGFYQREAWRIRDRKAKWKWGPYPVIKAIYRTEDIGVSWANYIGRTRSAVTAALSGANGVVIDLPSSAIDSIVAREARYGKAGFMVYFHDGTYRQFRHSDDYPDLLYNPTRDFTRWMGHRIEVYYAGSMSQHEVMINYPNLLERYNRGEWILVPQIPEAVLDRANKVKPFKDDNILGISVFSHP